MTASETLFIDRSNRSSSLSVFAGAAQTMRARRQSVYIFPEGTRSYARTPTLLPFKKGAFHLAVQAQVPVVPIVVANYAHVLDVGRRVFRAGSVPVSVLPAIDTAGLAAADVDALADRTWRQMADELLRLEVLCGRQPDAPLRAPGRGAAASGRAGADGEPEGHVEGRTGVRKRVGGQG